MEVGILKKLNEKRGSAVPLACVIVIAILIISSAVMEYIRLNIITRGVRDALQASIISVSTGNYDKTYNCLREGYSGGYIRENGVWREYVDEGDIYGELDKLLNLDSSHTRITNGIKEYSISELDVNINNEAFASENPQIEDKFTADAKLTLEVPLSFGWNMLPPLKLVIKTDSNYVPKF